MRKFRDIEQVRQDLKSAMPLNTFIEIVDNKSLEMANDHLYKKKCDLDSHPVDKEDGTRDSTASFTVCPQKELWWCFGCNTGGDRFEYVARKFHVDHMESIYRVAEIEGMDLTPYYEEQTPEEMMKDSLFHENAKARDVAHQLLLSSEQAMKYLLGRGISEDSIDEYQLGYAPPMETDRVTAFDSIPNSISLQLDRKDQFNDAILFPVCDPYGRMRYFQSRPFHPYEGMKYIGGNDTHPLFDSTDRVFGLSVAKRNIHSFKGRLLGVEGAPDAIACTQHGIPAIATLGTAVNQQLFDLLDRFRVTTFILVFDGDKAGWNASMQAATKYMAFNTKVRLKIVMMPDGDPDEYINKNGPEALIKLIDDAPLAIEHLVEAEYKGINPDTPTKKIEFMAAMEKYMVSIHDDMTREIIIRYIAEKVGFDPEQIHDYYVKTAASDVSVLYVPDEEETLLAEAMRNPEFMLELNIRFGPDDWYLGRHKELYKILQGGKYCDVDTIFQVAKNNGIDKIVTYEWLSRIFTKHGNIEFCMDDVEDKLIRRKAKERLDKLNTELMDMTQQPGVLIDRGMGDVYNTAIRRTETQVFTGQQQADDVMALIHQRMKDPGKIIGYDLGPEFAKLTRVLLGLQTKTLTVISANQSVGKTQMGEDWAMNLAVKQKIPVLWFTLEMDKDRMTFRNLSILSGIPLTQLLTGNITVEDKTKRLDPWALELKNSPFYLSEVGHDINEALAIARRYVMSKGVKIIFVDYVQLQYYGGLFGKKRYEELGMISKAWKKFGKDMDVSIVAMSQLTKEALKDDIAKAEHGAGSYEIAQDADNYITLKEKTEDEIKEHGLDHGNLIENVDKNRMGVADVLIDLYSDRDVQRMKEVE